MFSENANNYVNRELSTFSVAEGNLASAVNNNQTPQALAYIEAMSEALKHIRSSVRENMENNLGR